MENNVVLDVIIALLQGVKNNNTLEHGQHKIKKCNYLLNQTIRQYQIPQDHLLVSIKAKELWDKISTGNIISINFISLKCIDTLLVSGNLHTHSFQQKDQVTDIQDFRNIRNLHFLFGQENCTDHLQGLILGTLRSYRATKLVAAFYNE